jgi:RimJ/RimL family protein N-acetyltransferase
MTALETPRLLLRQLAISDLDDLYRILSDPITMAFWPAPFTREATQAWIERSIQSYRDHGFGRYAVILKESQALIGDCGILKNAIDGVIENDLGYIIFRDYWRQGYASEAAAACKRYGLETLQLDRICANMAADNLASRRTAEKIGLRFEREFYNARNRNLLTYLYAIEQPRRPPQS